MLFGYGKWRSEKKGSHVGPEYTVYPILMPFLFAC
jgi:hypothetical protein